VEAQAIFDALEGEVRRRRRRAAVEGFSPAFVVVAPAAVKEIARFLKDDPALSFDSLMCLSGVDYKEKFAVAYHLHSMKHRHAIGVKAFLPRENPSLPTVDDVWPAANFHEREAFRPVRDRLRGVEGPSADPPAEDWEGHPLRRITSTPTSTTGSRV